MLDTRLARVVSVLLVVCQAVAVAGVVAGQLAGGAAGDVLSTAGVLVLMAGPFLALVRIGVFAGRRRSVLLGYALGTMAITMLGVWLAR